MLYNISYRRVLYHTVGWLIFSLIIFIPLQIYNSTDFAIRLTIGVVIPVIPPVYLHFYLMDKFFDNRKFLIYTLGTFFLILSSGLFAQWFVEFMWDFENQNMNAYLDPLVVMIVTSGVRYYYKGIKLQNQLHESQAKQYKAEIDLLRYQVNPHFFFNTLNNLFSMARNQNDESTSNGIAKLSHLMRYIIYDCNVDKIELEKEINQISNFIELQKLRFTEDDEITINFNITGEFNNKKITPMLLIPFVENAFKHGVSLINQSPIDINLNLENEELLFSVQNKVNKYRKERDKEHSGIGLQNVKRRLELLYPENHDLKIENAENNFKVYLRIKL